ncbi:MAG: sigma-70 family RNA polymerase sigma factor [Planctomyces sp.]|nr:sigma-70 family RNA polymerase sigma factor [Planctomyces sp.]
MLEPPPGASGFGATGVSEITLQSLFDSEETPLLHYAFSVVGRRAVAEEIVQEVFLQLHAHWDEVQSPRAWLYRSVRNRAFKHLRDSKREVFDDGESSSQSSSESAVTDQDSPEASLVHMEAIAAVRQIVEELDEPDRQLLKLKYFSDLRYRDISNQTGITIGNVGYRLHHILKELADKLRKLGFDEKS